MPEILKIVLEKIEKNPDLELLKLTGSQASQLHEHLQKYHKAKLPPFEKWIEHNSFYGRKVQIYAPAKSKG